MSVRAAAQQGGWIVGAAGGAALAGGGYPVLRPSSRRCSRRAPSPRGGRSAVTRQPHTCHPGLRHPGASSSRPRTWPEPAAVPHRRGREHLARLGAVPECTGDGGRNAEKVVAGRTRPWRPARSRRPPGKPEQARRAADRPGRAVEGGDERVPRELQLGAAKRATSARTRSQASSVPSASTTSTVASTRSRSGPAPSPSTKLLTSRSTSACAPSHGRWSAPGSATTRAPGIRSPM